MKNEKTRVFVTRDTDFCLFLRGNEKKLMTFDEVVEALRPYVCFESEVGYNIQDLKKTALGVLLTRNACADNFAEVCETFIHLLWPENETA